jgi:S-adenosylmethionine hydrolase
MITLSSDFGSPYPAAMKGVIASQSDARLVDINHDFPRQNVDTAAFWLREILPYFPPAVHLVVVDPGVGTDRDEIVVRAGDHALVGPDNGVLLPAVRELAAEWSVFRLAEYGTDEGSWPPSRDSSTFHGRDIFAPMAAHVHEVGVDSLESVDALELTDDYEQLELPEPTLREGRATGKILAVDGFGNAITNIPGHVLDGHYDKHVEINDSVARVRRTYDEADPGRRIVTVGSHGNVELAVNRGRGDQSFGVEVGSSVTVKY